MFKNSLEHFLEAGHPKRGCDENFWQFIPQACTSWKEGVGISICQSVWNQETQTVAPSVQCGRMKETSGWYVDKAIHNHVYHDQFSVRPSSL